jgi:AcrR family transcriptional regulator
MTRLKYRKESEPTAPIDPRANQKERTRAAVVAAATQLVRQGAQPTVADAAELAKVSRATAYRYFPTQEALLIEVAQVNPAVEPVEQWLARLEGGEPEDRLSGLLGTFNGVAVSEEMALRAGLRVYLDTWLESRRRGEAPAAVREGRRTRWLDEALEPVRREMRPAQWHRLRSALALTLGVEALVVMKDVCNLSDEEALATLVWTAQALLRAGLQSAPTPARSRQGVSASPSVSAPSRRR